MRRVRDSVTVAKLSAVATLGGKQAPRPGLAVFAPLTHSSGFRIPLRLQYKQKEANAG